MSLAAPTPVGPESTITLGRVKASEEEVSPVLAEVDWEPEVLSDPEVLELELLFPQPARADTARAPHRSRESCFLNFI